MSQTLIVWFALCCVFFGFPLIYYSYMRKCSSKPWKIKVDRHYSPKVTILVATYNEANTISFKLENLLKLDYPKNLIQILLVDSASTDNTLDEVSSFLIRHLEMKIEVLRERKRSGKSIALNYALKHATGDVIVVSDADCFLPPDILNKALPFLADPSVGAVVGREVLLNQNQSWVTRTEKTYRDSVHAVKLGESKFYSTLFFEGGFSAYKKEFLDEFSIESDDCGTALNVIQKNVRTILVPEATFFTFFPKTWKGKVTIKIRRAGQLMRIWAKCINLLLGENLRLPKRIALSEVFLYVVNPLFFVALVPTTFIVLLEYPFISLFFLFLLIPKIRIFFIEVVQDNFILLSALILTLLNKRFVTWIKAEDSRSYFTKDLLAGKKLI